MRYIFIILLSLFTNLAYAKQIDIYTRFSPVSYTGKLLHEFTRQLNNSQNEYYFRVSLVPGANGESANQKALEIAKTNTETVLYAPISNFTINRYIIGDTYDRDNDFINLFAVATTSPSILVNPDSNINNIYDLLSTMKSKKQVYMSSSVNSVTDILLNHIFLKHHNINNVKILTYTNLPDIARSVLIKEADYTIFMHSDMPTLKPLISSGDKRLEDLKDIPIGKDIGLPDFNLSLISIFSVPKEHREFSNKLFPLLNKICISSEMQDFIKKLNLTSICGDEVFIKSKIKSQLELLEKYKDIFKPNN